MRIFKNQSFKTINALFNSYRSKIITLLTLLIITTITESIGLALIPAALSLLTQSQLNYQLPSILQPYLENFSSRYLGIWLLVIIFLSYIGKNIFNLISVGYSRKFCGMLRNSWRSMIIDKYFNSEAKLIRSKKAGKLIDSIITQPTKAAKFLRTLIAALNQLILSLAMLILLFFSSWKLTLLIGLIFSIFALVGSIPLKRISTNLGKQDISASQKVTAKITEAINGILQIKIFNLEEKWRKQIIKTSELQSSINVKSAILAETPSLIGAFAIVLILTTSIVITFRNNQPNLPLIAMFLLVCQRLNNSVGNLMKNYTNLRNLKPSFDLVQKLIIDENKFKKDKREYIPLKKINSLEIKNLSFSYPNQKEILKNINLEILKGQSCLIVGKSGSGKSTLINLICGLIYPKNGKIFINGFPLENIRNKKWLQKISYVSQDNYLFNDSIKNNLKLFNSKISDIEMIDACKKAAAHEFISNLSNGYETIVGERGLSLSGGQIQRLAIARALLKDGEVMIFDEATSALDTNNQELILNSLKKLSDKGKMIIFISHINQSIIEFDKTISLESIK